LQVILTQIATIKPKQSPSWQIVKRISEESGSGGRIIIRPGVLMPKLKYPE